MTHSKEKEPLLRQLGADQVVSDGRGLAEAGGADVILATSNSYAPVTDAIQGLRPDGRLVLMGVAHEPLSVPTSIMWVCGRILGSSQNSPSRRTLAPERSQRAGNVDNKPRLIARA
jgi:D-arabinose 1-dehydrogenase-like Zn-dependent alcohol dehydrogenase